jgi:hypothetical protein
MANDFETLLTVLYLDHPRMDALICKNCGEVMAETQALDDKGNFALESGASKHVRTMNGETVFVCLHCGAAHPIVSERGEGGALRLRLLPPKKKSVKVAVDQGTDLPKLKSLEAQGKVTLHQVGDLEQQFRGVQPQGRAGGYGRSGYGGPDMYANEKFAEVVKVVGPENRKDAEHVYAAYLNHCDYFVTGDSDFISGGRREKLERLLGLKVRRSAEFLKEMGEEQQAL